MVKIGHRGAAGYEPENTLTSFQKAIELGADMVELDVRICKTGEIMVFHDDTLERTTNGTGRIKDKTLAELKKLDAGKGHQIPTLSEVFDLVDKRIAINIELKGEKTALSVAQTIMEYVEDGWDEGQFLVSSFNYDELLNFKIFYPFLRMGLLFGRLKTNFFELAEFFCCYSIHPPIERVNFQLIENAHRKGLKVFVWTANDAEDIKVLQNLGVDGIFSDYPDRL